MRAICLCVLLAGLLRNQSASAADTRAGGVDPGRLFSNPPAEDRMIKIIHGWPDAAEAQDKLISRLGQQGFGGVVCNVAFDQYLESDVKWQAFVRAVEQAKRAGMAMWLYDERGYPSGNAGGLVLRDHPEWEARGLLIASEKYKEGPVELQVPPGTLFLAAAFPIKDGQIQLTGKTNLSAQVLGGRVQWRAPAGEWEVMAVTENRLYEGTHADGNLFQKMPYVNLLQPEATARFLELTHQGYADHLGADLGRYFMATFTDEPSLMSCFLRPMPYRPLPWAPNLPEQFQKRRGYALDKDAIPALVVDAGPVSAKQRYDFWLTVGELVSENYFGQIQDWCDQHHIPSGGHLLMEEGLVAHVPLYGDFFRCARRLSAPSIDCLTSVPGEVPWFIARLLASAAELEGRSLVMSETSDHSQVWRPPGDQRPKRIVGEAEIRGTCNRLIVSGVNSITSYYSFAQLSDEALQRLNQWVGRCCLMLRGGRQVADIAVVYPVESIWTHFTPARQWANEAPAASRIESIYDAAMEELFPAQRDFTIVDAATLAGAHVEAGRLTYRDLSWRVVVLPGVDTLPMAAWDNLGRFVKQGGLVIALGALPTNSEAEFPSTRVQAVAKDLFGSTPSEATVNSNPQGGAGVYLPIGSEGLLVSLLNRALEADVRLSPNRAPVRVTHRRIQGKEVYFLVNDSPRGWEGEVQFAAARPFDQWDPASGEALSTPPGSRLRIRLEPYGATLVRFGEAVQPRRSALSSGALPDLVRRPLPMAEAKLAHGEFVEGQSQLDTTYSLDHQPAWTARGRLRKGQVDTYLFVRLQYPKALDLSQSDCLAFDSWVPAGQGTPRPLIVILHEKDGGDFLVSTPRSLSAPGHERTFIPLARFQLAGWSKDDDGELDLKRVDEVRIGWGGYLGSEGEQVEFAFRLPETVEANSKTEIRNWK